MVSVIKFVLYNLLFSSKQITHESVVKSVTNVFIRMPHKFNYKYQTIRYNLIIQSHYLEISK